MPEIEQSKLVNRPGFDQPKVVYRFFPAEEHADALIKGRVWVSTLETCRAFEDRQRGDKDEGTSKYNSGTATGDSADTLLQFISTRAGIYIGPSCSNITVSNNTRKTRIPDGWLLCATERYAPDRMEGFGKFCVEIQQADEFFRRLTALIGSEYAISEALHGPVLYASREFRFTDPQPGPLGFVKPVDDYEQQQEYRMLWQPKDSSSIQPREWRCDAIRELVHRIA